MHATIEKTILLWLLDDLRQKDPQRRLFGANGHEYKLNPPLSAPVLEAFEEQHSVSLPADYKTFLLEIGNGGAGPFYGVLPFGQDDDGHRWESGGLVGDPGQPFRNVAAWNLSESFWKNQPDPPPGTPLEEEDRLNEAWDRELEQHYWKREIMNGAVPICHLGCALRQWLVVAGDQRGLVWNDFRADFRGISPVYDASGRQMTFADWYMGWLRESLEKCGGVERK